MKLAVVLGLSLGLSLAGCTFLRSEGEESLVVRNLDSRPLSVVVSIEQREGNLRVFGESVALAPGAERGFVLAMRPGEHTVSVTTSTSIVDSVAILIPETGDTGIEILIRRTSATITTTS